MILFRLLLILVVWIMAIHLDKITQVSSHIILLLFYIIYVLLLLFILHNYIYMYVCKYVYVCTYAHIKIHNGELQSQAVYVTRFAKRGLILASNFSTLQDSNSTCHWTTVLKFCSLLFLLLILRECKFWVISSTTRKLMPLQSSKIGCEYKTPFPKSGHIW